MSGRARPNFRRGEWIGYRKTTREQSPHTPAHRLPTYRLSFLLPDGMSLRDGWASGLTSVAIGRNRWIEVVAKNKDFTIGQVHRLMAHVSPYWRGTILAHLLRSNEPGPTLCGPLRRGDAHVIEIPIGGSQPPSVIERGAMRQLTLSL